MAVSARIIASVPSRQQKRLAQLADAKGLSVSRLVAGLIERSLAEYPEDKVDRCLEQTRDRAPAEKYTVRLTGFEAACLEARARGRAMTSSGYVAHVLRAHLRAAPPMPHKEFQELRRVVHEISAVRGALQQLIDQRAPREVVDQSLAQSVLRLLPALKTIRDNIQSTLVANAKSWETIDV